MAGSLPGRLFLSLNRFSRSYAIVGATAVDISGDGRVIVGYGNNAIGREEALFWVDEQGFRISDVALAAGVLPPSWEPFRAYGTDYFGNSIRGYGQATSGKLEAYVLIIDATPTPPPLAAPKIQPGFDATAGGLSIHYPTIPGLRYRVIGGSSVQSLVPLETWHSGLGTEQQFTADSAVTGGSPEFYLRLEVDQD